MGALKDGGSIMTFPETTPRWFRNEPIKAVPTLEDILQAEKEIDIAEAEYNASCNAGLDTTEALFAYNDALERAREMQWRRDQAILKDTPVCPI